jgi:hypothetical protein
MDVVFQRPFKHAIHQLYNQFQATKIAKQIKAGVDPSKVKLQTTAAQLRVCVCVCDMFFPKRKMRKWERAGMRSKNKPPKQNTMRNQEKEGMKEERKNKSTKRKKRTLLKHYFLKETKE